MPRQARIGWIFCALIALAGVILLLAGQVLISANILFSKIRLEGNELAMVGVGFLVLGLLARFLPVQAAGSLCVFVWLMCGLSAVGYRAPYFNDVSWSPTGRLVVWNSPTAFIDVFWQADPALGFRGIPDRTARHVTPEFSVTYRTDSEGWRRMPVPRHANPQDDIWVFGCSVTFGEGVADDETYSALLARYAWPERRVRNISLPGWATTNMYLTLQKELRRAETPPALVAYAFIADHRRRNHLRESYYKFGYGPIPHFEVEDGRLRFVDMAFSNQGLEKDSQQLDETETEITLALVREMQRACHERGVPLVIFRLFDQPHDYVMSRLRDIPDLPIIDVSHESDAIYPINGHPEPPWHLAVANALASRPDLARITGIAALQRPGSIPMPPLLRLHLSADRKNVEFVYPRQEGDSMILRPRGAALEDLWLAQIHGFLPLTAGQEHEIVLTLRSDHERPITYAINLGRPPWENLGCFGTAQITPQWQEIRVKFVPTRSEEQGMLVLALGQSPHQVELRSAAVLVDGKDVLEGWTNSPSPND